MINLYAMSDSGTSVNQNLADIALGLNKIRRGKQASVTKQKVVTVNLVKYSYGLQHSEGHHKESDKTYNHI